jgi:hypothetical protein
VLNLTFSWILLYVVIGIACSLYIEVESPLIKVILYYIAVILFWPTLALVFIAVLLIYLFKQILK